MDALHDNHEKDAHYWKKINCTPLSSYVPNDKYIIVTPWRGGMNNVRLSFELSCALAYCTNRVLVVPDLCYIDHLSSEKWWYDLRLFFDFDDLGISVMTLSDFCNKENIAQTQTDADALNKLCTVYDVNNFDTCHNYINVSNSNHNSGQNSVLPKCFSNRTEVTLPIDSKYVHFDKCLLGTFYSMLRHSNTDEANRVKRYVHRHVHYRPEMFEAAMKVVDWLKRERCINADGEYYAMHVRRGDFLHCDYKTTCISIEDVMKNIEPHIANPNACIYIATDSADLSEFNALHMKYTVVTFRDVLRHVDVIMEINPVFHGIVEQIICAHGTKFFSHPLSTFSNYVHRLRGYIPSGVSDAFCYQTTTPEKMRMTMDSGWACASNVWSKEFVDGYLNLMPD